MKKDKSGSKKKKGWIIGSVAAVLGIVALVLVFAAPKIVNAAMRKFASPEEYYRFVEKKSAKATISLLGEAYESILEQYQKGEYLQEETELSLAVDDGLRTMFSALTDLEFPAVDTIDISLDSLMDGEVTKAKLAAEISANGEPLLEGTMWCDFLKNRLYAELPFLLEETVEFEQDTEQPMAEIQGTSFQLLKLREALPEKKQAEKIVKRYVELIVDCVEQVVSEQSEIRVGNVKGECLGLIATMDEKTVEAMKKAVVKELQGDKELEQLMKRLFLAAGSIDDEASYEEFLTAVETFFDNLAENIKKSENDVTMTVWVDKSGAIVAREFVFGDGNSLFCAFLTEDEEVGFELSGETGGALNIKLSLEGEGTLKKGAFSGELKVKTMGLSVVRMELQKFDLKELMMGRPKGTFKITTAATLNRAFKTLEEEKGLPLTNLKLVLELKTDKKGPMAVLSMEGGNMSYGSLSCRKTVAKGKTFSLPEESVSSEKVTERLATFLEDSALMKKLEDMGITEEWLEKLFYEESYDSYEFYE